MLDLIKVEILIQSINLVVKYTLNLRYFDSILTLVKYFLNLSIKNDPEEHFYLPN